MPVYEYKCQDCGAKTDVKASIEEKSKGLNVRCEACESSNTRQVFAGIDILSQTRDSSDRGGCCGGDDCCCS